MFHLPKIYPITDARLAGISHAEQVEKLIAGGARLIQVREKHASPQEFFESAQTALMIARKSAVKIIINDRVDLALALKADGVHLGQDDLPPAAARKIMGEDAIIGFSTHNLTQAGAAVKLPIDYLAVGPVFSTQTKENPEPVVGLAGIRQVRAAIGDFPLVAIGGINFGNCREVFEVGADSAALISDLISDTRNIAANLRKFLTI